MDNEDMGLHIDIQFVCVCSEPVEDLGDEFFRCFHCDFVCTFEDCEFCAICMEAENEEE